MNNKAFESPSLVQLNPLHRIFRRNFIGNRNAISTRFCDFSRSKQLSSRLGNFSKKMKSSLAFALISVQTVAGAGLGFIAVMAENKRHREALHEIINENAKEANILMMATEAYRTAKAKAAAEAATEAAAEPGIFGHGYR